jgi:PHP family Zn ribbon phosphoesterase
VWWNSQFDRSFFFFSFFDKASLQQARDRIEQQDSASNIFTSVMEGTGLHLTADADFADLINALSTNSELANVPSLSF